MFSSYRPSKRPRPLIREMMFEDDPKLVFSKVKTKFEKKWFRLLIFILIFNFICLL